LSINLAQMILELSLRAGLQFISSRYCLPE
jgi:hypothetical protein